MEITFDDIGETDQILIRTENSEYRFSITNPAERRGVLTGGSLGDKMRDATLIGTLEGSNNNHFASNSSGLKTGARALFYLAAKSGIERLITSVITDIDHVRRRGDNRRAA